MADPIISAAAYALPSIVSGLLGSSENKKQKKADRAAEKRARYYQLRDRDNERRYAARLTAQDRAYAARLTADDRAYAASKTAADRAYAAEQLYQDRKYANAVLERDRKLIATDRAADLAEFKSDRAAMQALADRQAEKQAASRAIDFQQLRDDAIAAGFNPLTAIGFANSYSREVGYSQAGGSYVPGGGGYTGGGGVQGSPVIPSSVMPSSAGPSLMAAPSSYAPVGGGYQRTFNPALSTSQFMGEAVDAAISTYFNTVSQRDEQTYQRIADQVAAGHIAREVARQVPGDFGFALSKTRPWRPAIGRSVTPALASSNMYGIEPMPTELRTDTLFTPVDLGHGEVGWGLNPDREYSEITQTIGDAAVMAQQGVSAARHAEKVPPFTIRPNSPASRVRDAYYWWRGVQKGALAENAVGTRPVAPVFTQPHW